VIPGWLQIPEHISRSEAAAGQGLRTSLGRLGALGENGSRVSYSLAGRGSGAFFTIDRQDNPSSSGTSAP
jgi:hypothetical protein